MIGHNLTGVGQPSHLDDTILSSLPPMQPLPDVPSLEYSEHQESLFHTSTGSVYSRTSRLNSPFMAMSQTGTSKMCVCICVGIYDNV